MKARAAQLRSNLLASLAFAALAAGVGHLQPVLAERLHKIKDIEDVYLFPPTPVLKLATLGYGDAAVDVLWAKLLVEHGAHWQERRPFNELENYMDAILALEPTFRPLYEFTDSLLCYRPLGGHESDAREAKDYLKRGTRELPNDADIWVHYGQFVAFMAPVFLPTNEERQAWRREGALALSHAVDLGADVELGIAAGAMLDSRLGEHEASVRLLEHAYAVTDDEQERKSLAARLEIEHAGAASEQMRVFLDSVNASYRTTYPFVDRGTFMLIGPVSNPLRCVGPSSVRESGCARNWDETTAH